MVNAARAARLAFPAILLVALAIRTWVASTQTYVVFQDETFQYLEQAHRLVFGSGVVPWEYQDGIRSWLLPGLIAPVMWLTGQVSDDPRAYLMLIRLACVALSLTVVVAGFRLGERRAGFAGAVLSAGFCAIWFDLVWFAPAVLTEVLAAHLALAGLVLADGRRAPVVAGACLGAALCLRYQYAPALFAAVACQNRLSWRAWRPVLTGGAMVVLPFSGLLDWVTWGAPFQSVWLNFTENAGHGVSGAMGTEPAGFYLSYFGATLQPWPVFAWLIAVGTVRAPALAMAAAVTVAMHTIVPHKEVRFIYLAIAIAPILAGLGAATVLRWASGLLGAWILSPGVSLLLLLGVAVSFRMAVQGPLDVRWQFERAQIEAFLAAHRQPGLCGLAVRDVPFYQSAGYAYLHRDVPIFYEDFDPARPLPGSDVRMRLDIRLRGRSVPQFPGPALPGAAKHYDALIADMNHGQSGFSPIACFTDSTRRHQPPLCLFRRPGGCSRP